MTELPGTAGKIKDSLIHSNNAWVVILIAYLVIIIVVSLVSAVNLWRPLETSPVANSTTTRTELINNQNGALNNTTTNQNQTVPTAAVNRSSIFMGNQTTEELKTDHKGTTLITITNTTTGNSVIETTNTYSVASPLDREVRLLILSILFGIVGSAVHALGSVTMWYSKHKLERSYFTWYLTRPPIGASLAVAVYFLLRASLLNSFVNGGSELSGESFINDYGVAGLSVLVGLMTAQMTQKLRDVFDAFFGIAKGTDKGDIEIPDKNLKVIPNVLEIKINEDSAFIATVKDSFDHPVPKVGIDFGITDNNILVLLGDSHVETDVNGFAIFRVRAKAEGKTIVVARAEIGRVVFYDDSNVEVIQPMGEQTKPTETKPTETKPTETKPTETKPTGSH